MSVTLNEGQITAIARFNRSYAVKMLTITEHPANHDWITVNATLKAGKSTIEKHFVLDVNGGLVKNHADNQADSANLPQ
jgi:hypothetical protein